MEISKLLLLNLKLNALLDAGDYDDISVSEVCGAIQDRNLFKFMKDRFGDDIDTSLFCVDSFKDEYEALMLEMFQGYSGEEERKWKVKNKGLCLLVAWTNSIALHKLSD